MVILDLHDVKKSFGDKHVLKGINLTIPEGIIYGFVGENGAGKTTTMRTILGLETIDSGQIRIENQAVHYGGSATNRIVGYLPDVPEYYEYMTPVEYLSLCGHLTGMPQKELSTRIPEMLKTVDLPINRHRIHGFSRGMKQRLGIAQALLNRPRLLICDEPTSALDPSGRSEFLSLLASLKNETTIIFSTHILTDVERISDQVGILDDGVIKVSGSIEALKRQYAKPQIILKFASSDVAQSAKQILGEKASIENKEVIINYQGLYENIAESVWHSLLNAKLMPISMSSQDVSLEDIFMEVTS